MLNPTDHARLSEAAALISDVIDRHGRDMTLPVLSLVNSAINELRIAEKYLAATSVVEPLRKVA